MIVHAEVKLFYFHRAFPCPVAVSHAYEEYDSAEAKFHTHCNPHPLQSKRRGQQCSKSDAHSPYTCKVHHSWNQGIACAYKYTVGDD